MVRHAFTMIELIFALVIMGIVFITLPMILVRNADSLEDNLIQESIFLTSSKLSQALSFQWDNNSTESGTGTLGTADVLDVSMGAPQLDRNSSDYRIGHFREDKHRRMTPIGAPRSAGPIAREITDVYDDIDDFNGLSDLDIISATDVGGYKKRYRADINVTYVNDGNGTFFNGNASQNFAFTTATATGETNLKMIEVSIEQNNTAGWEPTLLLRAYVANIGETDYYKRRY